MFLELSGKASDVTLFQSWNATSLQVEGYAVVAVEYKNETWLNWYRITENGMVIFLTFLKFNKKLYFYLDFFFSSYIYGIGQCTEK